MKRIFKTISVIITLICLVIFGTFNAKAEDQNHILTSNKMWGKDALLTGNVTFDLNGYTLYNTNFIVEPGATLTIKDSKGTGKFEGSSSLGTSLILVKSGGTLILESGTITGNTTSNGAAISIKSNANFIMNGGKITNNTATSNGGAIYLDGLSSAAPAYFTMNGGTISENKAVLGGAIYSSDFANITLNGGTISSNVSTKNGGAIYLGGNDRFTFERGNITNNKIETTSTISTSGNGAGIYVGALSFFYMNNGSITNNITPNRGGGVFVAYSGTMNFKGGLISYNESRYGAGIYNDVGTLYLNNDAIAFSNKNDNVYLNKSTITILENTTFKGKIGISTNKAPTSSNSIPVINILPTGSVSESAEISSDNNLYVIEKENSSYYLKYTDYHEKDNLRFIDPILESTVSLSTGTYHLYQDTLLEDTISIYGDVSICLNGYLLYGNGTKPVFTVTQDSTLRIYDCNSTEQSHPYKINSETNTYTFFEEGNIVESTKYIDGGIISQANGTAPIIQVNSGTFVLESGKILGSNSSANGSIINSIGGNIIINSGEIANNYTSGDSLFYIDETSTITINGGRIKNNTSTGSNILLLGTAQLNGGSIRNNIASNGAGILVKEDSNIILGTSITIYNNINDESVENNIVLDKNALTFTTTFNGMIGITINGGKLTNNFKEFHSEIPNSIVSDIYNKDFHIGEDGEIYLLNKTIIIDTKIDSWIYGENPSIPSAETNYGEVLFSYSKTAYGTYSSTIPTSAGKYYLKAYVLASDSYTYTEQIISFEIKKQTVVAPKPNSKIYNSLNQTADISTSELYTVIENSGGVNVGTYNVVLSLVDKNNYQWNNGKSTDYTTTFTIIPKTLILEWSNLEFVYDHESHIPTVIATNLESDDECNFTLVSPQFNVGNYTVEVISIDNDNYKLPDVTTELWTIKQATTIISDLVFNDWTYGDEPSTPSANTNFGQITYTYGTNIIDATSQFAPTAAGKYIIKAFVEGTANYSSATLTLEFEINQRKLTYLIHDKQSIYSQNIQELTHELKEGTIVNNDSLNIVLSRESGTDAGKYAITAEYNNSNYDITFIDGTYTIHQAATVINKFEISNWTYGEKALEPTFTSNFGEVKYQYSSDNTNWSDVVPTNTGTYFIKASIEETNNYSGISETIPFIINPVILEITIDNISSVYSEEIKDLTYKITKGNIVNNDNLNLVLTKEKGTDAGTYKISHVYDNKNYTISFVEGTYTITQAKTIISNLKLDDWTFEDVNNTPSATTNFGNITYTYSKDNVTFNDSIPLEAGKYYVKAYVEGNENYSSATEILEFEIHKKDITVTIIDKSTIYGEPLKELTYILSSAPSNDLEIVLTKQDGINAKTYEITGTYNNNPNYNVTFIDGNYSILKAENKIIQLSIDGWTYGDTPNTPISQAFIGDVEFSYASSITGPYTKEVPVNAGTYFVKGYVTESQNYKYVESVTSFEIKKATHNISDYKFSDLTVKYDGNSHNLKVTGSIHETITIEYENNNQTEPGVYEIIAHLIVDNNFNELEDMKATLTILKNNLFSSKEIIVNSINGNNPYTELKVEEISDYLLEDYNLNRHEKIAKIYDISLILDSSTVQPDGELTIKLLIPELLQINDFKLIHKHNNEYSEIKFERDGNYIVFNTDKLSEFIFVYEETSLSWVIILISVGMLLLILLIAFQILYFFFNNTYQTLKNKVFKNKGTKLNSFVPLFLLIFNDSQLEAIKVLTIIACSLVLINIMIIIYEKILKNKIKDIIKRLQLEKERNKPSALTVFKPTEINLETDNEFIIHSDFKTHKYNAEIDDKEDEEIIEVIDAYKDGRLVKISYDRSFKAKLCQSHEDIQSIYDKFKNMLMSCKNLKSRLSWSFDSISYKGRNIARFTIRGKYLTIYLCLNPKSFDADKYQFKDVSDIKKYSTTPMKIKIKDDKDFYNTIELIEIMCNDLKLKMGENMEANYRLPYQTTDALIEQGLIKVITILDENGNPIIDDETDSEETTEIIDGKEIKLIYNRSFLAKLIQADHKLKENYSTLKLKLHSYKDVNSKLSWIEDSIYLGNRPLAKIAIRGKSICFYIGLNPAEFINTDYIFKDVSDIPKYTYTPLLVKIKNKKRLTESLELIEILANALKLEPSNEPELNYILPYQSNDILIEDGLIRVIEMTNEDDEPDTSSDDEEITTVKNGKVVIITHNKSFMAKLIQSSKEIQDYYEIIKNRILAYDSIKSRISWSNDSFSLNNRNIARFAIRGKSLYFYLALDPNNLNEHDYMFKDVSDIKKYANTPVMVKLKEKKNVDQSKKLFDMLAKELTIKRGKIPTVDYHQPFQTTEDLIEEGLIKIVEIEADVKPDTPKEEITLSTIIRSKISVNEAKSAMTDEEAKNLVINTYEEVKVLNNSKKAVINIDTLSQYFNDGDLVDASSLQEKRIVSSNVTHIKILARGELDKRLIVIADDFSLDAVKMIALMGGKTIKRNTITK